MKFATKLMLLISLATTFAYTQIQPGTFKHIIIVVPGKPNARQSVRVRPIGCELQPGARLRARCRHCRRRIRMGPVKQHASAVPTYLQHFTASE